MLDHSRDPISLYYCRQKKRLYYLLRVYIWFYVTHPLNHCRNEELVIQHIREIIVPYVEKIKEELGLPKKSLLIYDVFKGQTTKRYTDFLLEHDIVHVYVPANLTYKFQPLDINVNGVAKVF